MRRVIVLSNRNQPRVLLVDGTVAADFSGWT
jgi:hypothetical protein